MRLFGPVLYCSLAMLSFANAESIIISLHCAGRSTTVVEKYVFIATEQKVVEVASQIDRHTKWWLFDRHSKWLSIVDSYRDGEGDAYVTITDDAIAYGRKFFSPDNHEHISSNSIDRHTGIMNTHDGWSYDCSLAKVTF